MPNFDGGHYFLTLLSPIKVNEQPGPDPTETRETYMLRMQRALARLPTAQQSPATIEIASPDPKGIVSPFAKTSRTHLARFVVIEDTIYNGRLGVDAVTASINTKLQPTNPQHVDKLPCPYLMLAVDFDAIKTPGDALPNELSKAEQDAIRDDYLRELWTKAPDEMMAIYENCQGFPEKPDADSFAAYLAECQIETWMPFNDYYLDLADGKPALPTLPLKLFLGLLGVPLVAFVCSAVMWLTGSETWLGMASGSTAILALIVFIAVLLGVYSFILKQGQKPWPASADGDLASVLKGLYLQQKFSDFVVEHQGASDADLHKAFGSFVADHKPSDKLAPTQAPGVIKS